MDRTAIIRTAYAMCGITPAGEDPDTNQLRLGTDLLNMELKALQSEGIVLRTIERTTIYLVEGQAEYIADADTLDIDSRTPYVTNTSGTDMPLQMISRAMYMRLTTKDTEAQPTQMYVEKGPTVSIFLYPTPDSTWATLTYPKVMFLTDMDSGQVTTGLLSKYLRGVVLLLAADLAFHHGLLDRQRQLRAEYDVAMGKAVLDDTERGGIQFRPNYGTAWGWRR